MRCPNNLELQSFSDGELTDSKRAMLTSHIENCPLCREKLNQLQEVVSLIQKVIPTAPVPIEAPIVPVLTMQRRIIVSAAAVILLLALSGSWFVKHYWQSDVTLEAEIMEQYITLYSEDCRDL